jgi:sodium-dependent dicarboxylate transporter 2/3/5
MSDSQETTGAEAKMQVEEGADTPAWRRLKLIGLCAGPLLALVTAWALPAAYLDAAGATVAFPAAGRATAALAVWMAVWWMTEAIPLYATALLPLGVVPLLGAGSAKEASAPYGNEAIFLFLGGFLMALSMRRWGLDRRLAFGTLRFLGTRADMLVLGIMGITAFISLWVSNTATALTVYPIALSVLGLAAGAGATAGGSVHRNLAHALLLGVAYAATIGGLATPFSTPPNLILVSFARETLGIEIGFARWVLFGFPLAAVFLVIAWWVLVRLFPLRGARVQGVDALAAQSLRDMGPLSRGETATLAAFATAAVLWMLGPLRATLEIGGARPLAGLTDSGIAVLAAVALFLVPMPRDPVTGRRGAVMDWETAKGLPYGLLLLFGGGLSLAAALERTGVTELLAAKLAALGTMPEWAFLLVAAVGIVFLGELLSNTAMAAAILPVCAAAARAAGWEPIGVLLPLAWAASCGFMLPVATPPNTLVYGSGLIEPQAMLRAGFRLNLIGIALIMVAAVAVRRMF